jgi:hypothetical protein
MNVTLVAFVPAGTDPPAALVVLGEALAAAVDVGTEGVVVAAELAVT